MDVLWWVLIVISFVVSLVGIVVPVLPSVAFVWLGVLMFHLLVDQLALSWMTWGTMLFFTAISLVADELANVYVVKRYGGTKWTVLASIAGLFVGLFLFPPFGVIVVPFLFVFAAEVLQNRTPEVAMKVAVAVLAAFAGSVFAKILMHIIMIVVFLIDALS